MTHTLADTPLLTRFLRETLPPPWLRVIVTRRKRLLVLGSRYWIQSWLASLPSEWRVLLALLAEPRAAAGGVVFTERLFWTPTFAAVYGKTTKLQRFAEAFGAVVVTAQQGMRAFDATVSALAQSVRAFGTTIRPLRRDGRGATA